MSVTGAIMVAAGALVGVTDFIVGRRFATTTPEQAAEMERKSGKPADLAGMRLMGKILMISAPLFFVGLSWVGLSGMVD